MLRLLYSQIFKYTVLQQANLLYCATATVHAVMQCYKKPIKIKHFININNMQIQPSQIMAMLG
jgi:hypothetical protein